MAGWHVSVTEKKLSLDASRSRIEVLSLETSLTDSCGSIYSRTTLELHVVNYSA